MTKMQYNDRFLKLNFAKFLVPSMLAVLGGTVNVLVDDMMLAGKIGSGAIATLNVCMPFYLLICTIGSLIASGAAIMSSQALGKELQNKSKEYFDAGVTIYTIIGTVVTIIGLLSLKQLTVLLAGKDFIYLEWTSEYLKWVIIGTLPKGLLYFPFNYLPIEGNNKQCSSIMLSMLVTNVIFNYIFIYYMNMGMRGAGLASTLASVIGCSLGFIFFKLQRSIYVFSGFRFTSASEFWQMMKNGSPNALNNLCSALRIFIINTFLIAIQGEGMVATFAVVNALSEFSLCLINGVPNTAGALTGVYYSEKNNMGLRMILKIQFFTGTILITIFSGLLILQTPYWGKIFGGCEVDFYTTVPFGISLILALFNSIMVSFYARCNRVKIADYITVARLVLFTMVSLLLLANYERLIWMFLPLCELLTLISWLFVAIGIHIKDKNTDGILLLDSSIEKKGNVLDFSVDAKDDKICEASEQIAGFCEENAVSTKVSMQISMAIEEILVVLKNRCYGGKEEESFDLRVFALDSVYGIRIRCMGKKYNILEDSSDTDDTLLGVEIIKKMAEVFEYKNILGANTIMILFDNN